MLKLSLEIALMHLGFPTDGVKEELCDRLRGALMGMQAATGTLGGILADEQGAHYCG